MVHYKLFLILLPCLLLSSILAEPGSIRGLLEEPGAMDAAVGVDGRDLGRLSRRKWYGRGGQDRDLGRRGWRKSHGGKDRDLARRGFRKWQWWRV
jgi:hypothetical protein